MKTKTMTGMIKKAIIELLILKFLKEEDMYGYQITQEFRKRSGGRFTLLEGSMYPILYRLQEDGCISGREEQVGKRQVRIYYHLEPKGAEMYEKLRADYESAVDVAAFLLDSHEGDVYDESGRA